MGICNILATKNTQILICLRWTRNCDELTPQLRDSRVVDLQWGKKNIFFEVTGKYSTYIKNQR